MQLIRSDLRRHRLHPTINGANIEAGNGLKGRETLKSGSDFSKKSPPIFFVVPGFFWQFPAFSIFNQLVVAAPEDLTTV
ncbi:MAG TPA: hypothetical protein VJW73_04350 [Gemmatimonadaceae bacterium]|nr:hypothetical protein [Gemmatimonadaceae bacterium]